MEIIKSNADDSMIQLVVDNRLMSVPPLQVDTNAPTGLAQSSFFSGSKQVTTVARCLNEEFTDGTLHPGHDGVQLRSYICPCGLNDNEKNAGLGDLYLG
jgi:hypothetical protein